MSGVGMVYLRNKIWWIAFYRNGHSIRKSAKTDNENKARKFLREQMRTTGSGREHRVTFQDLFALVLSDYDARGLRSKSDLEQSRFPHLDLWFRGRRAIDITPQTIRRYISDRRKEGAANGTINRELGVLKRGFRLAVQDGQLTTAPHIQLLRELVIRQGFVSNDQFEAICAKLPVTVYQEAARFLYLTGWRVSEVLTLEWRDVDFDEGTIRLRVENSKNLAARRIRMGDRLRAILELRKNLQRQSTRLIFHRDGKHIPRGVLSRAWRRAAKDAKCVGIILHDLRRSAARNLIRAGAPERVAMAFLGHKTRSMFDRYNIVNDDDLLAAQGLLSDFLTTQAEASNVHVLSPHGSEQNKKAGE